jgi:hypothetical protein
MSLNLLFHLQYARPTLQLSNALASTSMILRAAEDTIVIVITREYLR